MTVKLIRNNWCLLPNNSPCASIFWSSYFFLLSFADRWKINPQMKLLLSLWIVYFVYLLAKFFNFFNVYEPLFFSHSSFLLPSFSQIRLNQYGDYLIVGPRCQQFTPRQDQYSLEHLGLSIIQYGTMSWGF